MSEKHGKNVKKNVSQKSIDVFYADKQMLAFEKRVRDIAYKIQHTFDSQVLDVS